MVASSCTKAIAPWPLQMDRTLRIRRRSGVVPTKSETKMTTTKSFPAAETGWKCFHCGVACASHPEATQHFGPTDAWKPACQDGVTGIALLARTWAAEFDAHDFLRQRNEADDQTETADATLSDPGRFKGAKTLYDF